MKEALLYEKIEDRLVRCYLCAHHCRISNQQFGICGVRQNIDGLLYTHVYARPCALHIDPIEKKPLYHFFPGSASFSVATVGCNFRCGFCQNWEISQSRVKDTAALDNAEVLPEEIVKAAIKNNCKSISYTYTEPTIFFEYAYETAKLAKAKGLYNNFVTNGYMTEECIHMIKPYLDAANVDLKFFKETSYRKNCAATLQPVLDAIRLMHELRIWVEVTTLVVPGENDSGEELKNIAQFIAGVDKDMPWHISKFYPNYKFTGYTATPEVILKKAQDIGYKAGLRYIYVGNVIGFGNDTYCPGCKKLLIKREVFSILEYNMKSGKCAFCNTILPGLFS